MINQVLCTCVWCLQESNGQGRSVNPSTRIRHLKKQKKTWPNPTDIPILQRRLGSSLLETTTATPTSSKTSISTPLETSQYQRDKNYNQEETQIYKNTILFDNKNDQIGWFEDEGEEFKKTGTFRGEIEEDNQTQTLRDQVNDDSQTEMLEDEEEEGEEDDRIEILEDEEEEGEEDDRIEIFDDEEDEDDRIEILGDEEEERVDEVDNENDRIEILAGEDHIDEDTSFCKRLSIHYLIFAGIFLNYFHLSKAIPEHLMKGLRLLRIKNKHNFSEVAFNEILKELEIPGVTLYKLRQLLKNLIPLDPTLIDCCINSCVAFTSELANEDHCPVCEEPRYKPDKTPRKCTAYWSLINSLRVQYKDKTRAETLRYRHSYTSTREYNLGDQIGDVFDGSRYKTLVSSGFFPDPRDIALLASTDGYQIFRQKRDDCWIILLINANLPPTMRVQRENLMISMLIPGPKAPKNFNSFLRPLVDDLKQLQGNGQVHHIAILKEYHVHFQSSSFLQKVYGALMVLREVHSCFMHTF
jgi:hypothetical protein